MPDGNNISLTAMGIGANEYDVIWLEQGNHTVPANAEDFSFT
ncbi:MAG: hypothetical protein VYA88_02600 [Actinomycetota bacterium]|nr:hypothetical protein [Actinomycetota bacterium]